MVFHAVEQSASDSFRWSLGITTAGPLKGMLYLFAFVLGSSCVCVCVCVCVIIHLDIEEGIDRNHFWAHVVGPL